MMKDIVSHHGVLRHSYADDTQLYVQFDLSDHTPFTSGIHILVAVIITALLLYIYTVFISNRAVILYGTNLVTQRPASLHLLLARKLATQPSINHYVWSLFTYLFCIRISEHTF